MCVEGMVQCVWWAVVPLGQSPEHVQHLVGHHALLVVLSQTTDELQELVTLLLHRTHPAPLQGGAAGGGGIGIWDSRKGRGRRAEWRKRVESNTRARSATYRTEQVNHGSRWGVYTSPSVGRSQLMLLCTKGISVQWT